MKKALKIGGVIVIALIVLGVIAGGSSDNTSTSTKEETKQAQEQSMETLEVVTTEFIADFDKNQLAAEEKYGGKMIQFSAVIDNISEDIMGDPFLSLKPTNDEYYFDTTIKCTFEDVSALTTLENGQSITLKGVFKSQDLGIIGLEKCVVVN